MDGWFIAGLHFACGHDLLEDVPKASDVPKTICFLKTMFLKHVAMNDCV